MTSPHPLQKSSRIREAGWLLASWSAVGGLTVLYVAGFGISNPTIVALSFLLIVLVVAAVSTLWVAVATSLLAFLCFNFFFLPPVGTFTIADAENWVALFSLLAVSIIASQLSALARRRADEAMARRDELGRLFDLTRDILLTTDTADAVALVARYIARRFNFARVTICLPGPDGWQLHHSDDEGQELERAQLDQCLAAAQATLEFDAQERTSAGHGRIEAKDGTSAWLVPLRSGARPIGLMALQGGSVEPGTGDAIAGVTAIAIERTQLLEERKDAEVMRRSAELKSALLAALSHDLRTPLTAVTVAASNLQASWLTEVQRREQTDIVLTELGHLNRLFQNLVDMGRIETDAVAAEREWVQPAEIVEAAIRQVEHQIGKHTLDVQALPDRMLVNPDPRLTSAALAHLLENAAQYSPEGSTITLTVSVSSDDITIAVWDRGMGIALQDLEHVFEPFYRGAGAGRHTFGTGMGLAITRGLLAAEGGRVCAGNHPSGGALFTMTVPTQSRTAAILEEETT